MSAPVAGSPLDRLVGLVVHWWRLLVEPDRSLMDGTGRWRVKYGPCREVPQGGLSRRMSYRQACNYAEMFGGVIQRVQPNASSAS